MNTTENSMGFMEEFRFLIDMRIETLKGEEKMYREDSYQPNKKKRLWVNHDELILSCFSRYTELENVIRRLDRLEKKHNMKLT